MANALSPSTLVAVVGAGAMGAGIAQVAVMAWHPVRLLDNRPGAAQAAVEALRAQLDKLAAAGLVVEAIVENLAAKQKLFADLEALVPADCLFGSNTSSISITAIGSALQQPQRLAGLHFFNPAPLMALVEVVSGLATALAVADTLHATATAWGKTAVHAKSTPGFIVNRVARPYYAEALRLLTEGAADCATLDAVMRESGGFRMGPFELMDMIGLDVNFAVTRSVWNAYFNDPRYLPSLVQQELVDAGYLGRKSGRGYYDYRAGADKPQPQTEPTQALPAGIVLCGESAVALALAARLRFAAGRRRANLAPGRCAGPGGDAQRGDAGQRGRGCRVPGRVHSGGGRCRHAPGRELSPGAAGLGRPDWPGPGSCRAAAFAGHLRRRPLPHVPADPATGLSRKEHPWLTLPPSRRSNSHSARPTLCGRATMPPRPWAWRSSRSSPAAHA